MTATRNPRILSVQPVGDGGGSEHALIGLIRELTAAGWECHVALPGPVRLAAEYDAAGAHLHVLPMAHLTTSGQPTRWAAYAAGWPLTVLRLAVLGRRLDADVVHSNSLHTWHGWAAAALLRRPHVWHAREIVFQSRAALAVERFLTRHFADRVVAVSGAVAAQLDPGNVEVILDRADPARFGPHRAGQFRAGAGIGDATPLAGFVGRFDSWKGLEVLLDAFDRLRRSRPDAELVVAGAEVPGKRELALSLQRQAERIGAVHWVGWCDDVPALMADLDVFVSVSSEPEPFGLVVVEALASGTPVVAGAAGGPLEVLGPAALAGATPRGRLVPPGDPELLARALAELLPRSSSAAARRARAALPGPAPVGGEGRMADLLAGLAHPPRRRWSYRKRSSW